MLAFYLDEFGDHSMTPNVGDPSLLKTGTSPFFVLAAVGFHDSSRRPLAEAIVELKLRHFGSSLVQNAPWSNTEIKGRHLRRAQHSIATGHFLRSPVGWQSLKTSGQVEALIEDLRLTLVKFRPLIFAAGVDKLALLARPGVRKGRPVVAVPPLSAAYAYVQQRVALLMEEVYGGESALLVADQQVEHEKIFRSGRLNADRAILTDGLPMQPNFNLVLDKPLWIDTELSTWDREILQLADIVAYSAGRCLLKGQPPSDTSAMWETITRLMAVRWSSGRIEGGGFAIYPRPGPGGYPSA